MAIIRVNVPLDFANAKKTVPKAVALHLEDFLKSIYMDVSKNSGVSPQTIHYKPSILGYHYFWKHPYRKSSKKSADLGFTIVSPSCEATQLLALYHEPQP